MLGDIKFHKHDKIDPRSADRWKIGSNPSEKLGNPTRKLAEALGYEMPLNDAVENENPHGRGSGTTLTEIIARPRRNTQIEQVVAELEVSPDQAAQFQLERNVGVSCE
jgi:hypothetical protein